MPPVKMDASTLASRIVVVLHEQGVTRAEVQVPEANEFGNEEAKFDALYHAMGEIQQFGRTGRFDALCLLGSIGLISVKPGSCYLKGSTGPLRGARKLFGRHPVNVLARLTDESAKYLEIAMEVFEDALCNWQKVDDAKYPESMMNPS